MVMGGLTHKVDEAKRATRSYIDDRITQTETTVVSYAVAAGLFAAAGIFLVASLIVGAIALYSWIELRYGTFYGCAAVAAPLALIAIACVMVGTYQRKKPAKHITPLATRLRVAVTASPLSQSKQFEE